MAITATKSERSPRFSGHETFVCRYAWLPKVVQEISAEGGSGLFRCDETAMVKLGIGKNMVHSARFWAEAAQVIEESDDGGHKVTDFGCQLLHPEWHDPYLERIETLWLIHWKIATNPLRPLFHWTELLNNWHRPEFYESEVLPFLEKALPKDKAQTAKRTLSDGFRVFVNSYVPSRGRKGEIAEDNLDCPLVELGLIRIAGERLTKDSHREPIYSFNIEQKPPITSELIAYCLHDFWQNSEAYREEKSLGLRVIGTEAGSPGQVFKLPESALSGLLDGLSTATNGAMVFEESRSMQQVWMKKQVSPQELLEQIYKIDL
jgi:hypothetical protein